MVEDVEHLPGADPGIFVRGGGSNLPKNVDKQKKKKKKKKKKIGKGRLMISMVEI